MIDRNDIANYAKRFTFVSNDGTVHSLLEIIYPVGVYYWSSDSTSPKELFGFGEWDQIKDRFILAIGDKFKTVNETGGSFKIETDKIPSHIHNITATIGEMDKNSTGYFTASCPDYEGGSIDGTVFKVKQHKVATNTHDGHGHPFDLIEMNIQHSHSFNIDFENDVSNFPNKDYIQPYITAYCWKRIE